MMNLILILINLIKMFKKEKDYGFNLHPRTDFSLLRAMKPSVYDHLGLFQGYCFAWREKHQRQFTVRACLKNLYKMLDLNRHPLLRTTSRRSAPLGDPRGIPKLSRKFSQRKSYLRVRERAITSVHNFKFEGSVNIFVASTSAKKIFFEVNIDIAKMSDFVGSDLSLFDGLLEQLGDSMEYISDEGTMPNLNNLELDFTNEFDMDMFNDPSNPTSSPLASNIVNVPATSNQEHSMNIPNEIELTWTPDQFFTGSMLTPVTESELQYTGSVTQPELQLTDSVSQPELQLTDSVSQPEPQLTGSVTPPELQFHSSVTQIEKEKNNQASREYRQRKKSKLAALQDEAKELEQKNQQLRMKEAALQEIVNRLKSKLVSVLANERTGSKRHHDDDHLDKSGKKLKL